MYKKFTLLVLVMSIQLSAWGQVPTITSFTPASGPVGTSVVITGTNFSATAASNIVFFGATRAAVTNASATTLTVTVPPGATYEPISVVTGGLTAWSNTPFLVTFPGVIEITPTSFLKQATFPQGLGTAVTVGDLDADGKPDVVVRTDDNTVSIYRNTTVPLAKVFSFASPVELTVDVSEQKSIAIGDLNGDGKPDLAVSNRYAGTINIFRNEVTTGITGTSFVQVSGLIVGDPKDMQIRDIDLDGYNDLVVCNFGNNSLATFRNTGAATIGFETIINLFINSNPVSLSITDVDGDGKPDLASPGYNANTVSVLRNISTPGVLAFETKVDFICSAADPSYAQSMTTGDLDDDGKPELIVSTERSNAISILRNVSVTGINTASFESYVSFPVPTYPHRVRIGDLDGDASPDVIVQKQEPFALSVFRNVSTSGISTASFEARFDLDGAADNFEIVDLNADGKPDVAGANGQFLLNVSADVPSVTDFQPRSGLIGAEVVITGGNFHTTTEGNVVYFGAAKATVLSATPTSLTVQVPPGATYEPIRVTVNGLTGYSSKPFVLTPDARTLDDDFLQLKASIPSGSAPFSPTLADLDSDGKPDLITANANDNTISLLKNVSVAGTIDASSFSSKVDFVIGENARSLASSDLDGDGMMDIVVSNFDGSSLSVFRNANNPGAYMFMSGTLDPRLDIATAAQPNNVNIADLDGDGRPEIVYTTGTGPTNANISILKNNAKRGSVSASSFSLVLDLAIAENVTDLVIRDIDLDGKPEIIAATTSNHVAIYKNVSSVGVINSASFLAKVDLLTLSYPSHLAVGDIDGDELPEIIVSNSSQSSISVFRNNVAAGVIDSFSFSSRTEFSSNSNPEEIELADLNGDGKVEIAVLHFGLNTLSIYLNTSSVGSITQGTFASRIDVGRGLYGLTIGDVDGDNFNDIMVAETASVDIYSLWELRFDAFDPASGHEGSPIVLTGTKFDPIPANNIVKFNDVSAAVTSGTSTSLTATVPTGAATGQISITVGSKTVVGSGTFTVIPPPAIQTVYPISGPAGTSVTISGTNFSPTPAHNVVKFNGTTAIVTSSSATSITTSVPAGAATGKITVTTGIHTVTSANDFTVIPPPYISQVSPESGPVGKIVSILGWNFDPIPTNNTVLFNGTPATVTSSDVNRIITSVPTGATDGPITVTVAGQTVSSPNDFTITIDNTAPEVNNNTSPWQVPGSDVRVAALVLDESPITSVSVEYRNIAAGGEMQTEVMTGTTPNFEVYIPASELGELGIEYKLTATSNGGTYTSPEFLTVQVRTGGYTIPYSSYGTEESNYRIVAIPLELENKTVGEVFNALGSYNKTRWRMFRYSNAATAELTMASTILPGWGYWLIIKTNSGSAINTGIGTSVMASSEAPFEIDLNPGWNQIGNPYNFNISWADVQAANPGLPGLRIFNGDFVDGATLRKMEGGFVKVNAAQKLRFPVVKNAAIQSGRVKDEVTRLTNPIDGNNWQVYFTLQQGDLQNRISGFGMNKKASQGFDPLDGFNMPKFFGTFLQMSHHKREGDDSYSSDIVPPADQHVWEFEVTSTEEESPVTLRWDNSYFGVSGPELFLWDEALQRGVDMRKENSYVFHRNVSSQFKVFYGSAAFVKEKTSVSQLMVHEAWPNPATDQLTISFSVPESLSGRKVEISINDALGKKAWTYSADFTGGYHEVRLGGLKGYTSGIYFLSVRDETTTKLQRIVLR